MKKQIIVLIAIITLLLSCSTGKKTTQIKETTQQHIVVAKYTLNNYKLDSLFDALEKNDKFMGSIVLSHKGKTIYTNVIGFDATLNPQVTQEFKKHDPTLHFS